MADSGTTSASGRCAVRSRTSAKRPGRSKRSPLSISAFSVSRRLAGSSDGATKNTRPGNCRSGNGATRRKTVCPGWTSGMTGSGTVKVSFSRATASSSTRSVRSVMRSPGDTSRGPSMPANGARISVRSTSTRARSTRAWAASRLARARSRSAADTTPVFASASARRHACSVSTTCACASRSRARCSGSRRRKSSAPDSTSCPSRKSTLSMIPLVSARIITDSSASSCPVRSSASSMVSRRTLATSTAMRGGPALRRALSALPPHAASAIDAAMARHARAITRPGNNASPPARRAALATHATLRYDATMDFDHSPKVKELLERVQAFLEARVYPNERLFEEQIARDRWAQPAIVEALKAEARAAGLWNLFLPHSPRGPGLTNLEYAPLCEVMGRSHMAPEVFNCAAPDTGNMEVLDRYGSPEQQDRWLRPLLDGTMRSAFAMTEPDVASSDATNIRCEIRRDGDHYVVNGRKWWTSGILHPHCEIMIVMGKTNPDAPLHLQQSQILVPRDTSGVKIVRHLPVFGYDDAPHGHGDVLFEDVR